MAASSPAFVCSLLGVARLAARSAAPFDRGGDDLLAVKDDQPPIRDEIVHDAHWFLSLADARTRIEAWRRQDNDSRLHTSLGWMTPSQYAASVAQDAAQ